jgi:hypothetical protein
METMTVPAFTEVVSTCYRSDLFEVGLLVSLSPSLLDILCILAIYSCFLPLLFPLVDSEPWLDTGVWVVVDLIRLML